MENHFILSPYFIDQPEPFLKTYLQDTWELNTVTLPDTDPQSRASTVHKPLANKVEAALKAGKRPIIIEWSNEDQAFIAEVPELPGCMADGKTHAEAVASAEVIIQEWLETAKELGKEIPEPEGRLIAFIS
jgi:predicted RNase H-like HicB family nuclease